MTLFSYCICFGFRFHSCNDENDGNPCVVEFIPEEEAWHYLQLSTPPGTPVQLSMAVKLHCELL